MTRSKRSGGRSSKPSPPLDPVTAYATDVVEGRIIAGLLVRLACERHLRDLIEGPKRGLWFDVAEVQLTIEFFTLLHHYKGEYAGQSVTLEPWQIFIVGSVFGWKRRDGTRRFRTAWKEVARKNGKSTVAAGVGLKGLVFDDEPGAEIYAAATKKDQAKIIHGDACQMVRRSPSLKKQIDEVKNNLSVPSTASKFEPLGADEDTLDGLNSHMNLIDEVHAHRSRGVVDVLNTSHGSRRQPLDWYVTTAGQDKTSVCWELREYSIDVLKGTVDDDSWFAVIYTLDDDDEWTDEKNWVKANPNLNVSVKLDYLREQCKRALSAPGFENAFRRLHLNQWTAGETRFIPDAAWARCAGPVVISSLARRLAYGALDLSSTTDLSAWVLVFPPLMDSDVYTLLPRFWVPRNSLDYRKQRERELLEQWINQGLIVATDGDVIDYNIIRRQIHEDADTYQLAEVAFDPWNATQLCTELESDGLTLVKMQQGFATMAAPTKEFLSLAVAGRLAHGDNPVLAWMNSNTSVAMDPAGNMKPDKGKSRDRIDGIVAAVMGVGRASAKALSGTSVYETRGLLSL